MKPIHHLRSRSAVLPFENIDTDRIIPARFLTTTERTGLGRHAFNDWRYAADGSPNLDFPLNRPDAKDCAILVAGRNFGCGSSREHAPWALLDYGITAVISSEIADIFRSNALKNGLLAIVLPADQHAELLEHPGLDLAIDVAAGTITLPDGRVFAFALDGFARHCLLSGLDPLGFLLDARADIDAYEQRIRSNPYPVEVIA
ncbi:3-isopropylmalate dehydratase small subunit [Dokdonella koreensis]|uniref:3-isopropylmalate dehydratase small subunit n=1 Tax=Dokdonella koreensis DS-123 TaxID=1300342 RepID=A0A167G4Y1_9GAMM|nr:3-isopropylmalate dehydratase small subunit [Dokdonella koreensis]ANB16162.1 3-isopropylmalate dehydratase small subunit [Dokdonella koreensis DS-123]